MNPAGWKVCSMLLRKSEANYSSMNEVAGVQLLMCLVAKVKSDAVKNNIA